jgi:hypothetical protein
MLTASRAAANVAVHSFFMTRPNSSRPFANASASTARETPFNGLWFEVFPEMDPGGFLPQPSTMGGGTLRHNLSAGHSEFAATAIRSQREETFCSLVFTLVLNFVFPFSCFIQRERRHFERIVVRR